MVYLETERLLLKNLTAEDAPVLYQYRNNTDCAKYQRWDDTELDAINQLIQMHENDIFLSLQEEQHYAIALKDSKCIGDLSLFYTPQDHCITLGITISPKYQHQGYAFEILKEVVASVQHEHPQLELVALIDPENQKSIELFAKLGFQMECYAESIASCVYTLPCLR